MDLAKPGFIWGVRPTTQKSRLPLIAGEAAEDPAPEITKSPRPKKWNYFKTWNFLTDPKRGIILRLATSSPNKVTVC